MFRWVKCWQAGGMKLHKDARNHQIMVLFSMLIYGLVWLKFDLNILWLACILGTALVSQFVATKIWRMPRFEWRSALISGLSLCILMRCDSLWVSLLLIGIAIFSKFIIRWNDKHIFNPTNLALAIGILWGVVRIDPGQWANGPALAFFILCMGIFVSNKACRSDISFSFLGVYAATLFAFAAYSGGTFEDPIKRLQTASLLIFTFFMISDPRSTPNARVGRVIFGVCTALVGLYLQLGMGMKTGLILSLVFMSLTTPVLDYFFRGEKFYWNKEQELKVIPG